MTAPTDPETLEAFYKLAIGDNAERRQAQDEIFKRMAPALTGFLGRKFFVLDPASLENCVSTAFLQFFQRTERDDFDPDKARNLLFTIGARRANDVLRSQKRGRSTPIEYVDEINAALEDTETGKAWQQACERASEIAYLFGQLVTKLPKEQQEVARAMAKGFPDQLSDQEISQIIFDTTGKPKTVVSVKRCRQEIREKFKPLLARQGIRTF